MSGIIAVALSALLFNLPVVMTFGVGVWRQPDENAAFVQEHREPHFPIVRHRVLVVDVANHPEQPFGTQRAFLAHSDGIDCGLINRTIFALDVFPNFSSPAPQVARATLEQTTGLNGFPRNIGRICANSQPYPSFDKGRRIVADVSQRAFQLGSLASRQNEVFDLSVEVEHRTLSPEQRLLSLFQRFSYAVIALSISSRFAISVVTVRISAIGRAYHVGVIRDTTLRHKSAFDG